MGSIKDAVTKMNQVGQTNSKMSTYNFYIERNLLNLSILISSFSVSFKNDTSN